MYDGRSYVSLTLFSSRPPNSFTNPSNGYSLLMAGISGVKMYLHMSAKVTNPDATMAKCLSAMFGSTWGTSGPHIE